ncbi:unnamed protein product [Camellia sinensis]
MIYTIMGKYYLVDAGYKNQKDFLAPFKGCRYHQEQFSVTGRASNANEVFNTVHSSLRSAIARTFGVWKARWGFLHNMPQYDFGKVQVPLVGASMTLHNFIRHNSDEDEAFNRVANAEHFIFSDMPNAAGVGDDDELDPAGDDDIEMNEFRKSIRNVMVEVEQEANKTTLLEEANPKSSDERTENRKKKRKRQLLKEVATADKRGVCYLSRIPPHMDPLKLRQILSQYGEIQRIYLTPEDPAAQVHRKRAGGFRGVEFSEGWVEFSKRSIAKRVAKMLNGEQIGGRKRSAFFYDLWNIKYLSKFKWDDLTEEIAYKNAIREQKMALEISAAKRERDFYLSKVDQSRALVSIEERMKKKRKLLQESGMTSELPQEKQAPKVIRQFPQTKPVSAGQSKPRLSRDILAG